MKPLKFSSNCQKKLRAIQLQNPNLFKKIQEQLSLFLENPRHKSLRLHRIQRKDSLKVWSISINMNLRMLYSESESLFLFFDIGTHEEVYKKK